MLKAVLDTNVLVSGLLKRDQGGIPDQILRSSSKYQIYLCEEILEEANLVFHYPRIQKKRGLSDEVIADYLGYLRTISVIVSDLPIIKVTRDPDDNIIIACAVKAGAHYIISGDPHLKELEFYRDIKIVAPVKFLNVLNEKET